LNLRSTAFKEGTLTSTPPITRDLNLWSTVFKEGTITFTPGLEPMIYSIQGGHANLHTGTWTYDLPPMLFLLWWYWHHAIVTEHAHVSAHIIKRPIILTDDDFSMVIHLIDMLCECLPKSTIYYWVKVFMHWK
jgi:hypothetical protein